MAKTKQQKKKIVEELVEKLSLFKGLVFAGFNKLTVKDSRDFKNLCRENEIDYIVTKKKLLKIALEKNKLEVDPSKIEGEVALVISKKEEIAPAKIVTQFMKNHEALAIKGGILESRFLSVEEVKNLAMIPGRNELLAKLVGSLNAPIAGFVTVLKGNLRGLVQVLGEIQKTKN